MKKWPVPPRLLPFVHDVEEKVTVSKIVIIANPYGGGGKGLKLLQSHALPIFLKANITVDLKLTERKMHAAELARTLSLDGVDVLCAIGGDGTLSEVVTGFMQRDDGAETTTPLGFLPGGTGNAFMREFHEGGGSGRPSVALAAEAIVLGLTRKVDVVRSECVDHRTGAPLVRYSLNGVFWGLGTDANMTAEKLRCLGPIRYDLGIVWEILKLRKRQATLTLNHGEPEERLLDFDMLLVTAMNTKYTGDGLSLSPKAQMDDGLMDVVLNTRPIRSRTKAIGLFDGVKAGGKHIYDREVTYVQTKGLRLETPKPTRLNFDGELVGATPLEAKVVPQAVRIVVPRKLYPAAAELTGVAVFRSTPV